ncbi:MAG TPA: ATP-grasp domain-containing protein [Blastocatellia bacterium]|nr:ATP-grasp domain-containing protein [Blastocatellia bacterium]
MSRLLLLLPTTTYRTKAFLEAALAMGVEVAAASERANTLADKNPSGLLLLNFNDPDEAAREAVAYADRFPVEAVIPVDEDTAVVAANIAHALGIPHNSRESVAAAKNKHLMRRLLATAGVRAPRFRHFTLDSDLEEIAASINYPSVVKPVFLSTSRGVMRVNTPSEFRAAVKRLEAILALPHVARRGGAAARDCLVEEFIPGVEVAVEGLLAAGRLRVLALFDKPDPLDGPFFEETIYVTPSRLPRSVQREIAETTQAATRAMGLTSGAIHAELRINDEGAWVIEVAARAIGGLCSRTLRFGDARASLEELIVRHALGEDVSSLEREPSAAAVMMIPIPRRGILKEVKGIEEARGVPDIEDVIISAHITQELLPPPEGAAYLGFIFSRASQPGAAEAALREAHARLEFVIE